MLKAFFTLILSALFALNVNAQMYKAKEGTTKISFFSKAPLEDITATNNGGVIVYNPSTNNIQIIINVIAFKFKNSLMEEHFNENYMETEKFPNAIFKGKINEQVDLTKDGETKVTVTGKMEIHGETKEETYEGTITKKGNELTIKTKFKISVVDYKIKVPSMYVKNIAEVVDVDVYSVLEPFQKK